MQNLIQDNAALVSDLQTVAMTGDEKAEGLTKDQVRILAEDLSRISGGFKAAKHATAIALHKWAIHFKTHGNYMPLLRVIKRVYDEMPQAASAASAYITVTTTLVVRKTAKGFSVTRDERGNNYTGTLQNAHKWTEYKMPKAEQTDPRKAETAAKQLETIIKALMDERGYDDPIAVHKALVAAADQSGAYIARLRANAMALAMTSDDMGEIAAAE